MEKDFLDNSSENKDVTLDNQDNSLEKQWADESQETKTKRHAEQLEWSRKEVERVKSVALDAWLSKIESNASSLLELHDKDPKFAKEVAAKVDWDNSEWKDYDSFLQWVKKKQSEDDFETKYQQKRSQEKHEEALKKVEKEFKKLPEDLRWKAQTYFDKITKGKQLNEEDAMEFAEMTTLYVNKDKIKEWSYSDTLADLASTGVQKSQKPSKEWSDWIIRDGKLVNLSSNKQS